MTVDVHAHYWTPEAIGEDFRQQAERTMGATVHLVTDFNDYWSNAPSDCRVIVFGGKARLSQLWQDDNAIAALQQSYPSRCIGFLSVDLACENWREDLAHGHQHLRLRGVKLMPMYGGFYPNDRQFDDFWSYVSRERLPVILHVGTTFISQAPLDCTLPRHLDDVAIRFPEVRLIMAHLGHPYEGETLAVIRKHTNVYADISALYYRPWQIFNSLILASEYRVMEKLFFGTDFPFTTVNSTIDALHQLCEVKLGGFSIPREGIEDLINRNPLPLLGLE